METITSIYSSENWRLERVVPMGELTVIEFGHVQGGRKNMQFELRPDDVKRLASELARAASN